jgi:ribokinase
MERRPIVVVGSINMDLVLRAPRIPAAGETLTGSHFATHPGGKGANQAVGIARLDYPVRMIGMVGRDGFGDQLHAQMAREGVDVAHVGSVDRPTGVATITVNEAGENSIVVIPGANAAVTPDLLRGKTGVLRDAGLVLAQLEIPLESVLCLAILCAEAGVPLILDPAPAQVLPQGLLPGVEWVTPNETEAGILTSGVIPPEAQSKTLQAAGAKGVILKRGAAGVAYSNGTVQLHFVPAPTVKVLDTTAAGDAFNAAFAVGLMRAYPLAESVRFAVAAAAFSVTREGAQPSLARSQEVEAVLANV